MPRHDIIDAETGRPIHRDETRELEHEIAGWAYPAVLPAKTKRILVHKLWEMQRNYRKVMQEFNNRSMQSSIRIPLTDLPKPAQKLIKNYQKASDIAKSTMQTLHDLHGINVHAIFEELGVQTVRKTMPQHEIDAFKKQLTLERSAAETANKHALDAFIVLLKDIAKTELDKVRKKIAPDLIARLDAIGPERQLLAANPAHPAQAQEADVDKLMQGKMTISEYREARIAAGANLPPLPTEGVIDIDLDARAADRSAKESRSVQRRKAVQRKGRS